MTRSLDKKSVASEYFTSSDTHISSHAHLQLQLLLKRSNVNLEPEQFSLFFGTVKSLFLSSLDLICRQAVDRCEQHRHFLQSDFLFFSTPVFSERKRGSPLEEFPGFYPAGQRSGKPRHLLDCAQSFWLSNYILAVKLISHPTCAILLCLAACPRAHSFHISDCLGTSFNPGLRRAECSQGWRIAR